LLSLAACQSPVQRTPLLVTTPQPTVATSTIAPPTAHKLHLEQSDYVGWVVTDETYIYWVPEEGASLYRYPLLGGDIETIASTRFPNGTLSVLRPLINGDWLVFMDTQYQLVYTPYILRAINVEDGLEYEIVTDAQAEALPPSYAISADRIVWTTLEKSKDPTCSADSVLVVQNIRSAERRELDRVCIDNNYMWEVISTIGISGNYVIAAQFFSDAKGNGRYIHLFDLTTGTSTQLNEQEYGRMPALNGDWVAWLTMRDGNDLDGNTIVLNLKTGVRKEITPPIFSDEPFIVANRWLYWDGLGGNQLAIYDLATDEVLTIKTTNLSDEEATTGKWYIKDNTIAWSINVMDPAKPGSFDVYLEWLTGADPKTLLTQVQQSQ
jgi:hypothetical protein